MEKNSIVISGAREHNLKNIHLTLPRDQLIVFTGLSGSGKSSLAFDTIYADGQRRYIESLSAYARQFLGQMEKPDVDDITGLSPAISIDQKTTSKNPRSTVGTVTEIYDYLRLLYARIGTPHCPICGVEITHQTIDQIVDHVLSLPHRSKIQILAPLVKQRKGSHVKELESVRRSGYVRVRIDGSLYELSEEIQLNKNTRHNIDVVVDRLIVKPTIRSRLADSIESAISLGEGLVVIHLLGEQEEQEEQDILFSMNYACPIHHISLPTLEPNMFSFNNPAGACPTCTGLGTFMRVDIDLIVPDQTKSVREGAIRASGWYYAEESMAQAYYDALAKSYSFDLSKPFNQLPEKIQQILLYGTGDQTIQLVRSNEMGQSHATVTFEGVIHNLERRFRETQSPAMRDEIAQVMSGTRCPDCHGNRLKKEMLAVTVGDQNISEFCSLSVEQSLLFVKRLSDHLTPRQEKIAQTILKEIEQRLGFLHSVGLDYLTLARSAGTLSGGESQRIRLATQIGSSLMGVLYILDEPSIGLHQRDNDKLIAMLKRLRDLGNTLIVVEHDQDTMYAADHLVDVGPGAGIHGGKIVAQGTIEDLIECEESLTGQYLSGKRKIPVPQQRCVGQGNWLRVVGATQNNLKNLTVSFPLGTMTCVTGVSGSGKSSLVNEVILKGITKKLANHHTHAHIKTGKFSSIEGVEHLDKIIDINQAPIGRTPRSNPATYTGVFTDVRQIFSITSEAKMRGYSPGRFSFNVKGGRCEACSGDGINQIEMHFLPDVYVPCDVCKGRRYNRETLEVQYKGKNIYNVLDMTIEEAMIFFENHPKIYRKLKTLYEVGLGYVKMGQSATTLSGGEAQRVKLATELAKRSTGRTLYVLDEPTTGLHMADVHKLVEMLRCLVDAGNTVLVIEHNLEVIKVADYLLDLGPEGGNKGGKLVAKGTPEQVATSTHSYTGQYLKKILDI